MRKLILAGVIASLLIAAPIAFSKIVIQKSITGVSIGMSEKAVVAKLGKPKKISGGQLRKLNYGATGVWVNSGKVTLIRTFSPREGTANGVGVGTTEDGLKRKVTGLNCTGKGVERNCFKGSGLPGTVFTTFYIDGQKRVREVIIARISDD